MATIRLIPSAYSRSNTSYVTVTNPSYMYNNTDDTSNYAQLRGRAGRSSNSTYYAFIHGFNFDDVPENAEVTGFRVLIRAYRNSYQATGNTNYRMRLASQPSNSYAIGNTTISSDIGTSASVYEIPTGSLTWETIKNYGSNFSIDIPLRNSSTSSSYYPYVYVYGAEIEVTYTMPDPRTITTTLSGNGTISPSGSNTYYDGDEVEVIITPTNKSDTVTVTHNGTDVTSQLVAHGAGSTVTKTPDDVTTSGIQSGSSYAEYAVGHSAESPSSSGSGQNMYASSSSTGYASYSFDFSSIPSNATIEDIEVRCYGHRESNTISSTYVSQCVIYQGSSAISEEVDFPNTSDNIITLTPTTMPTRSQLDNVTVRHYVGYYGGLVRGISFDVTYSTGTGLDHYTYTFTVSGDSTIAVVIGSAATDTAYFKVNGTWTECEVYKKINGSWVKQTSLSGVFDSGTNYKLN